MSIKTDRAKKIAMVGKYHQTWRAVLDTIPNCVIAALTSAQIATLADAIWAYWSRDH